MVSIKKTWLQFLIAVDQVLNALCCGYADETLSARSYRNREHGIGRIAYRAINGLFFWQEDHCRSSWESEVKRRQLPPVYRDICRKVSS